MFEISDKKSHSHSQGKPINCSLVLKKTNDETGERGTDPADDLNFFLAPSLASEAARLCESASNIMVRLSSSTFRSQVQSPQRSIFGLVKKILSLYPLTSRS